MIGERFVGLAFTSTGSVTANLVGERLLLFRGFPFHSRTDPHQRRRKTSEPGGEYC